MLCAQLFLDGLFTFPATAATAHVDRDESFNSITGLNGSGKSNILDAICFVLGLTNMSSVSVDAPCHPNFTLITAI